MTYAGIDIGTSKAKLVIFENDTFLKEFEVKQKVVHDENGDLIDASKLIENVFFLLKEAFNYRNDIEGISITSFGESFVCLDENDKPLFDIPLFIDESGRDEIDFIKSKIDEETLYEITGCPCNPMYSLPKLLSLRRKNRETFKKVTKILLMEDYVIYKLTGKRFIDYGLACRSMMFDIHSLKWSDTILDLFDIDKSLLSETVETGHIAGDILESIKRELNITHEVKIINGSHDQIAVAIGSNLSKENFALGLGTCECLTLPIKEEMKTSLLKTNLPMVPFKKNMFITYGLINNAGSLIQYFSNLLGINLKEYELNIPDSDNFIITNFPGENSQKLKIYADFAMKKDEYLDLIFESLSYELKCIIEYFKGLGVEFKSILVSGGSSVNLPYLDLISSVCNVNIIKPSKVNIGLIGNAIIVGTALGYFKSYEDGFKKLQKETKLIKQHKFDLTRYQKYINLKRNFEL